MKLSTKLLRIKNGITQKLRLNIKYNDVVRDVEPHILGYNHENEPVLRVFERVRANSRSNEFKTYLLSAIQSVSLSKLKFTRTVTKSTDEAMKRIILTTYDGKTQKED